jgi:hypothetical protein
MVRKEMSQVSKPEIVAVSSVEYVLRGIESRNGNSIVTLMSYSDVLQARETQPGLSVVVRRRIEASHLQTGSAKSTLVSKSIHYLRYLIDSFYLSVLDRLVVHHAKKICAMTVQLVQRRQPWVVFVDANLAKLLA